jgi:ABC-2 type transport system ATP-binding protein
MTRTSEGEGAREAVASAQGVTKRFAKSGVLALDGVNLTVQAGNMTGLVGPDGAGKTTLVRMFAGLIEPDQGKVSVLGQAATASDHTQLGYMPQRFGLYEDLTVIENLRLYADLRNLVGPEREASFEQLLKFTELKAFQSRRAGKLSGGMKQKLGLACALLKQPRLLLLDEPSVGVDPISRRELWDMVKALINEGVGVLWTTAYLDEAERCDTVYLLHEGKMLYTGPPAEVSERVQGRVFRVPVAPDQRRPALRRALDDRAVMDGVIQGDSLRMLMRDTPPNLSALAALGGKVEPVKPSFEDAFVDMLGGGPPGTSRLAQSYATVADTNKPVIVADRLTKKFGDFTAADGIQFEVLRGQIFGLLGPNGAGKSTTFKMLCGLLTPTSGAGSVAGHDLRSAGADARQSLGYMAQKFSLYGELSVHQNLRFFSGIYGLNVARSKVAIERSIEVFGLKKYLKDNSGDLPLGFKQRLALACAVIHEPPVLFLDEPTSGVDPIARREFWTHINGLVERGVTVLVTTHFMDEAEYCDRIALVYRAKTIAMGSPDELKVQASVVGAPPNPTLEDTFIALMTHSQAQDEEELA